MNAYEHETVINASDGDELVRVWTAQRKVITQLRNHSAFTEIRSGFHEAAEWAEFTTPASRWTPAGGIRHRSRRSTAEIEAATARLRAWREAKT